MSFRILALICWACWGALLGTCHVRGQEAASPSDLPVATRPLAPGVLTVIPPESNPAETVSGPRALVEITAGMPGLAWTPNYEAKSSTAFERARRATFRRPIWNLEFSFKPLRMIEVEVPTPEGLRRKPIWYLVYRVRNVGQDLGIAPTTELPIADVAADRVPHNVERVNFATRRFFPHFVLESHDYQKEYLDRLIPAAKQPIQARENPGVELLNSVEISQVAIPLSDDRIDRGVWGFVTWEDIDPRIDFFSVNVRGLTNAFQYDDPPGALQPGNPPGTGRVFRHKTLRLNFWRPGDTERLHERELRYGVPVDSDPARQQSVLELYGLTQRLDYLWVYR